MPLEDFEVKEQLGKGSFGSVFKAIRKSDGEVYAIKQIKIHRLKEKDKKNALNQIRFLASIDNPYIVSYKQAFYDQPSETLCIVMEFANQCDLQSKIKRNQVTKIRLPEEDIWRCAYQVLQGLSKLHELNIIHRDIKPANIFFHNGLAKIGDLNVAKHLVDQFAVTQTGTPYYASPEVWNEQPYNFKSDIWSLGCVLYEMAMLKPPFRAQTPDKLFKKIMSGEYEKVGAPYSKELSLFMSKLLTQNQIKRPSIAELLCYPIMMDFKQSAACQGFDQRLLKTIKFSPNLKQLNESLPAAKYEKPSTMKQIPSKLKLSNVQSTRELLSFASEKHLQKREKLQVNIKDGTLARHPKTLLKNGSQKLIF